MRILGINIIRAGGTIVLALIAIVSLNLVIAPFVTNLIDGWSRRDVEGRSTLIFNSLRPSVEALLAVGGGTAINVLFDQVAEDERVLAVGLCDTQRGLLSKSAQMPADFSCAAIAATESPAFSVLDEDNKPTLVGSFPFSAQSVTGHLVVLSDLSFVDRRSAQARQYIALLLTGIGLLGAAATIFAVVVLVRSWRRRIQETLEIFRTGAVKNPELLQQAPLGRELFRLIRDLDLRRETLDTDHISWSAESLKKIVHDDLGDTQIIAVSNREPHIHNAIDGRIAIQHPASGLVAALEPVMRACQGTWIAHGSGSADQQTVDSGDRIRVPPDNPRYTLRRIWISAEEQRGFYYGLSNEGVWPLCHIAYVRPVFREEDWQQYKLVNQRFAEAVVKEAHQPDPIVLIQDYHFALLPAYVRRLMPRATIITFWHIPWPNSETFGICPWKEEILQGLLGSTIVGFHTRSHCNNFLDTVDRFIESRVDRELASVTLGGHEAFIRAYPISIEWPPAALENQLPIDAARSAVRIRYGIPMHVKIAIGVERFDYTKGILDRMRAVDALLVNYSEWAGKFVLLQIAAPTRSELSAYRELQDAASVLAEEINTRHRTADWKPIILVIEHRESHEVFELFRASDVCIVSSLHDGMNLVAKEFVAARDDDRGVLILSSFAGASRELSEALIVNPFDPHSMGENLRRALMMPVSEQVDRMRVMRNQIRSRNVYRWAGRMLLDAEELRKKQRIVNMATEGASI